MSAMLSTPSPLKPKSLSSEGTELLRHQGALIAKILSFAIEDTKGLADLRLVCREWNDNVRLHVFKDFGFRRVCRYTATTTTDTTTAAATTTTNEQNTKEQIYNDYCAELVKFGEGTFAGRYFEFGSSGFDFKFFVSPKMPKEKMDDNEVEGGMGSEDDEAQPPGWASTEGLLFCMDDEGYRSDYESTTRRSFIEKSDSYRRFATYCHRITTTKSFDDFQKFVEDGIAEGLFLCMQDLEKAKREGKTIEMSSGEYGTYHPMIVNLRLPRDHGAHVIDVAGSRAVYLKVKIEKEPEDEEDLDCAFPYVADLENSAMARD
ncbi:MAG: hypothetical protein SGBAC_006620, partial [Bacillariaceae sp.]